MRCDRDSNSSENRTDSNAERVERKRELSLADEKQSICASRMHEMRRVSAERNRQKEFLLAFLFFFFLILRVEKVTEGKARGLTLVLFGIRLV